MNLRHFLKALPFVGSLGWLAKEAKIEPQCTTIHKYVYGIGESIDGRAYGELHPVATDKILWIGHREVFECDYFGDIITSLSLKGVRDAIERKQRALIDALTKEHRAERQQWLGKILDAELDYERNAPKRLS